MRTAILITVALMLVATAAVADAKWPVDYVPGTPADVAVRVGGDDIANAVAITDPFPFTDTGNTCNFANDYDEVCDYSGSLSPDVVYSWYACEDGLLDISLCNPGTTYDTKLYVYENDASTLVGCNDDSCSGFISELGTDPDGGVYDDGQPVPVVMGNTYYIVVDGYGGDCGDYEITVDGPQCTTATESSSFSLVKSAY